MTFGSLDEWLSQRSAKPCTAVRIRQEPLLTEKLIATVPWMSGLVSGLQNRVRRFESARNLKRQNALLAQLVEQLTLNQWVQGSNP